MEAYEYIISQSPNEYGHDISVNDAPDGIHANISSDISPIRDAD